MNEFTGVSKAAVGTGVPLTLKMRLDGIHNNYDDNGHGKGNVNGNDNDNDNDDDNDN